MYYLCGQLFGNQWQMRNYLYYMNGWIDVISVIRIKSHFPLYLASF